MQQRTTSIQDPRLRGAGPMATPPTAVPSPSTPPEAFSLRIVSLDHYMASPIPGFDVCWSELEGGAVQKVPVVRIFGPTPAGQKACLHLHGAFPYCYVPYEEDLPQDPTEATAYIRRLALALNAALSFSPTAPGAAITVGSTNPPGAATENQWAPGGGGVSSSRQRVFGATLVRGVPFYGYYPDEKLWVKLMFYDPKDVGRAASLLLAGAVLGRSFQPHESHVPYLLQLKIDLNLQGMGYLTLGKILFRGELPAERAVHRHGWALRPILVENELGNGADTTGRNNNNNGGTTRGVVPPSPALASPGSSSYVSTKVWVENTVHAAMKWAQAAGSDVGFWAPSKVTTSDLELDGKVEDVLNRQSLVRLPLENAGPETKMVESLAPMWEEERIRCGGEFPPPPPELPRTPQQLGPGVATCREQFQAIETQIKECLARQQAQQENELGQEEGQEIKPSNESVDPSAGGSLQGGSGSARRSQHLLRATQPANAVPFPSQPVSQVQRQTPAAERAADVREEDNIDYGQFVDTAIIMTQHPVGPRPAVDQEEEEAAEWLRWAQEAPGLDAEELELGQNGEGGEEDLLLALAMQLTQTQGGIADGELPSQRGTQPPFPGAATAPVGPLSQIPSNFPGSASQAATYRRAQAALEQFLAATQRECDEILECSLQNEDDAMKDQDMKEQELVSAEDSEAEHAEQEPSQPFIDHTDAAAAAAAAAAEPQIPQVDGGFDDDVILISNPTQTPRNDSSFLPEGNDDDDGTAAMMTQDGTAQTSSDDPRLSSDQPPHAHPSPTENNNPPIENKVKTVNRDQNRPALIAPSLELPPPAPPLLGATTMARVSGLRRPRPPVAPVPSTAPSTEGPHTDQIDPRRDTVPNQNDVTGKEERNHGNGALEEAKGVAQGPTAVFSIPQLPSARPSAAYVPRDQVRASSQSLGAAMRLLAPPDSDEDMEFDILPQKKKKVLSSKPVRPGGDLVMSMDEQHVNPLPESSSPPAATAAAAQNHVSPLPLPPSQERSVLSGSLPPTQPLESPLEEETEGKQETPRSLSEQFSEDVQPVASAIAAKSPADGADVTLPEVEAEEEPCEHMEVDSEGAAGGAGAGAGAGPPLAASIPSANEFALAASNAAWWREEVSQVPFDDLEWDLLDEEAANGDDNIWEHDLGSGGLGNALEATDFQEVSLSEEDEGSPGVLYLHRFRRPPPSQAQLLASGWDAGVLPVIHPVPHYSNPAHVPRKPPVFAGKEFRVPCTAVRELPVFSSVMEQARAYASASNVPAFRACEPILYTFTPARRPPTRAETDTWLAAEASRGRRKSGAPGTAGFVMDPNTGKMVPTGRYTPEGISSLGLASGSASLGGAGDLLATPSLASIPSSGAKKGSTQQRTPSFGAIRRNSGSEGLPEQALLAPTGAGEALPVTSPREEVRPASPKYDERSFFYSNPFVGDETPSLRGRPGSRSRLSMLGSARGPLLKKTPVGNEGSSPALGSNNPPGGSDNNITPVDIEESIERQRPGLAVEAVEKLPQDGAGIAQNPSQQGNSQGRQGQHARLHQGSARKSALKVSRKSILLGADAPQLDSQGSKEGGRAKRVAFSQEKQIEEAIPGAGKEPSQLERQQQQQRAVKSKGPDNFSDPGEQAEVPSAKKAKKVRSQFVSQITPPSHGPGSAATPSSQMGFKRTIAGKGQGLTLASVEVHADCRGKLLPDPRHDAVRAVVIAVTDDDEEVPDGNFFARIFLFEGETTRTQAQAHAPPPAAAAAAAPGNNNPAASVPAPDGAEGGDLPPLGNLGNTSDAANLSNTLRNGLSGDGLTGCQIERFSSEIALLDAVVAAVQSLDPDILMGFEVQKESLGYLSDRAAAVYERPHFLRELSRMPEEVSIKEGEDQYGWQHASGLHVAGRIVLNVWRLMRAELKLNIYTLENCAAAVLRLRIPHIPPHQLAEWFRGGPGGGRWRCLSHITLRSRLSLALLDRLDLVGRTAELARTFGIDFFSVLSRGSQYRVESMMLRLAHSQNFVALAPSPEQVARQPAMEAIPLVMEPRSTMYPDPVIVLDFQSLYPSMIIAYNLCFSTCVGRPSHAAAAAAEACGSEEDVPRMKLGCLEYVPPVAALAEGQPGADGLVVAPNGVAFVPPDVRPGVLPRLLNEILNTRIMVKAAMKRAPPSARVLLRCLNARQFGLKLIANVTYGYTAAGFSGRMPMAELADAIVQSGRATLEAAITMVESHPTWRAKVVYGDTDSLFVQLPGRTVEEAFAIGAAISKAVTAANPPPVMLKLEKVYRPCVLLSKKRYVGAMYESPGQKVPTFDAKGIETVRRDACPAVAKIMEQTLRLLFASADLSTVRDYLERQWTRILSGRVSVSDFIFAKEVRLGTYSARASVIPPAALVATRAMSTDPRAEPRYGERVPYVVVYGEPGARLADMVVPPRALVESGGRLRLHAVYYITKQIIPSVERALSLVGADVRAWFAEMPRPQRTLPQKRPQESLPLENNGGGSGGMVNNNMPLNYSKAAAGSALTIERFYLSRHCAVCDELTHASKPLCEKCLEDPQIAAAVLAARCNRLGRQYSHLVRVCGACGGGGGANIEEGGIVCDSLDCGVFFERRKVWQELTAATALGEAGFGALMIE